MRRGLGVINRFDRLRHNAVVGGNDQHNDVGDIRAARAHRGERGVAWSIDKRNLVAIVIDTVRADVLRDPAGFASCDARLPNRIQQTGFTMIDVPHESDNRRARLEFLFLFNDRRRRRDHTAVPPCEHRRLFPAALFPE